MKLEELSDLEPAGNQVLVRVRAAGVNPVDTYVRQGVHPSTPPLPFTPGKDGAGVVESVGVEIDKVKAGDRVYLAGSLTGTYAEFALCEESQVWRLPGGSSFEEGAGVFVPYATAHRALFKRANAKAGETVLIHGASGAVGVASIQWAKNAGLTVVGTASSEKGKRIVAEMGADFVFDHSEGNYLDQILETTDGQGVNIVLEMLANVNLVKDFKVLAKFGRIVVIGSRGSLEFDPRLTMGKDASILGVSLFNASREEFEEIHEAIFEGLSKGVLKPEVGKIYPLAHAADAHVEVIEGKSSGKIVLIPDDVL